MSTVKPRSRLFGCAAAPVLFLLGVIVGIALAFWWTQHRRSGLPFPRFSVERLNGRQALIVSVDQHPPWSQSNYYDVAFDYDANIIRVTEYYVIVNPFSRPVRQQPPIVIQNGLVPGTHVLTVWEGTKYKEAGRVVVGEDGEIEWHPSP